MFVLKKIYCRLFQLAFRAALPILRYREPSVVFSCEALTDVFLKEKTKSALVVTDKGIIKNSLLDPIETVLRQNKISNL